MEKKIKKILKIKYLKAVKKKKGIRLPMQETQEMQIQSLGQEDPLEEGVETCSNILA